MRINKLSIICTIFLVSLVSLVYATEHVVISELGIDPAYQGNNKDEGKEFIELYNPTDSAVDIGYWYIAFSGLGSSWEVIIPADTFIEAYGYYLIGDTEWMEYGWPSGWNTPDLVEDIRLDNSNFGIRLLDSLDDPIDVVGWGNLILYPNYYETATLDDPINGHSYERRPGYLAPECGNWKDTNNNSNDFLDNSNPEPQNSSFIEEPCNETVECTQNSDCDDGLFCNGQESCNLEMFSCVEGTPVDCNDDVNCTNDSCNEDTESCDNIADDANCDDEVYCNGQETCDIVNDCQAGTAIDCLAYDITGIANCDNDPDNNPFTWDYRTAFSSVCDENNRECATSDDSIMHSCDIEQCGAGCESNEDCEQGYKCNLTSCSCVLSEEPYCGDGIKNGNEECDNQDFEGLDCTSFGFDDGFLVCEDCVINTDNCFNYDSDGDGIQDSEDDCPFDSDNDIDNDEICGDVDNCPSVPNQDQTDNDGDSKGDACDEDDDNDGLSDPADYCPLDQDNDVDEDEVCADVDNCPTIYNEDQADADKDNIGDVCDYSPSGDNEGNSGNSGGGSSRTNRNLTAICTPNWQCDGWSNCQPNGKSTRTCSEDLNNCGGEKPIEERACYYYIPVKESQSIAQKSREPTKHVTEEVTEEESPDLKGAEEGISGITGAVLGIPNETIKMIVQNMILGLVILAVMISLIEGIKFINKKGKKKK